MQGILKTENEKEFKKMRVGRLFYKIVKCDKLIFNNKNYIGFIDYDKRSIYIEKGKYFKETLRHELSHAFINEISLKNLKYKKLKSDEFFINALSELINQNYSLK
jgi:hypothetical protein